MIGPDIFAWVSKSFNERSTLRDIPDQVLERISSVDVTLRNLACDLNAVTSIALITFAYKMAQKVQKPRLGVKDIVLLKVLAKNEKARRHGLPYPRYKFWDFPLFALITGEVGERTRDIPMMNSPI
jgi:hypothetical protein